MQTQFNQDLLKFPCKNFTEIDEELDIKNLERLLESNISDHLIEYQKMVFLEKENKPNELLKTEFKIPKKNYQNQILFHLLINDITNLGLE